MIVSKSGRALAFASSFTVCLLAAGALAITLLGRPHGASITLDLPESLEFKTKVLELDGKKRIKRMKTITIMAYVLEDSIGLCGLLTTRNSQQRNRADL